MCGCPDQQVLATVCSKCETNCGIVGFLMVLLVGGWWRVVDVVVVVAVVVPIPVAVAIVVAIASASAIVVVVVVAAVVVLGCLFVFRFNLYDVLQKKVIINNKEASFILLCLFYLQYVVLMLVFFSKTLRRCLGQKNKTVVPRSWTLGCLGQIERVESQVLGGIIYLCCSMLFLFWGLNLMESLVELPPKALPWSLYKARVSLDQAKLPWVNFQLRSCSLLFILDYNLCMNFKQVQSTKLDFELRNWTDFKNCMVWHFFWFHIEWVLDANHLLLAVSFDWPSCTPSVTNTRSPPASWISEQTTNVWDLEMHGITSGC